MTIMNPGDLETHYRSLTEDELVQLSKESGQLSPDAKTVLDAELSRRRIGHKDLDSGVADSKLERRVQEQQGDEKYSLFPSLRRIRETLRDWQKYRRQTGKWPYFTITFSFLHLLVDLAALGFLIWYSGERHWSKGRFVLVIMPLVLIDVLISDWLGRKIRLFELARYRQATVRQ